MTGKDNITSLFGKSPISPLQQHMKQVHSCLKEFGVFAKAANTKDWEKPNQLIYQLVKKNRRQMFLRKN